MTSPAAPRPSAPASPPAPSPATPPPSARPPLAHRWFFALKPDDVMAHRTHAFAAEQLGETGLLPPAHHHITLALTPDFPDEPADLIAALLRAGDAVAAAPFTLHLDRLSGSARTVALRPSRAVPPLRALQAAIAAAMAAQGIAMRPDWRFSPHETLCYRKGAPFQRPVAGFHWSVTGFVLVHSVIGRHRHETIGQWPLHAAEPAQGCLF